MATSQSLGIAKLLPEPVEGSLTGICWIGFLVWGWYGQQRGRSLRMTRHASGVRMKIWIGRLPALAR